MSWRRRHAQERWSVWRAVPLLQSPSATGRPMPRLPRRSSFEAPSSCIRPRDRATRGRLAIKAPGGRWGSRAYQYSPRGIGRPFNDGMSAMGHSRLRWSRPRLAHVRFTSDSDHQPSKRDPALRATNRHARFVDCVRELSQRTRTTRRSQKVWPTMVGSGSG